MSEEFLKVFFNKDTVKGHSLALFDNSVEDDFLLRKYARVYSALAHVNEFTETILDIGCGPAIIPIYMSESMNHGKLIFLDISPEMIKTAKKNAEEKIGNDEIGCEYILSNGEDLGKICPPESIDAIISRHVIHLMDSPEKFFASAYSGLKKGGKMVFSFVGHTVHDLLSDSTSYITSENGSVQLSMFHNHFYRSLLKSTYDELPRILESLDLYSKKYLVQKKIISYRDSRPVLCRNALTPKLSKSKMDLIFKEAGIPLKNVSYYILPETHTVEFKRRFSQNWGSIPIPGVWDILPLMAPADRYAAVNRIYDVAFPDKNTPVRLSDAVYVVTKQ